MAKKTQDLIQEEYQILGILLQHPELIDDIADQLEPHHFAQHQSRVIYHHLLEQYQEYGELSRTRLYVQLKKEGLAAEPEDLLEKLTSGFLTPSELKPAVEMIRTRYQREELIKAALKIQNIAGEEDNKLEECQARAQEIIFAATTESLTQRHIYSMEDALMEAYQAYLARKSRDADTGILTGFISLDRILGGIKKGHLSVLAASTSVGKSAFALNLALNIIKRQVPVAIISLEMDAQEIMDRIIINESEVNGWRYSQGETSDEEDLKIAEALDHLYPLPLSISDERGLSTSQVRARLRKFRAQTEGLGLAIIDYLQLLQLPHEGYSFQNMARAVGENVLQLRNMASELEIPILLLSQISRSFTSRTDKRPVLSDLRDSGNIEEIADSVLFLYRHAHTSVGAREEAREEGRERDTEVIVAKNRTGMTGNTTLFFEQEKIRFIDPENLSIERCIPGEG